MTYHPRWICTRKRLRSCRMPMVYWWWHLTKIIQSRWGQNNILSNFYMIKTVEIGNGQTARENLTIQKNKIMETAMPNSGQNPYHENEGTSEQKMSQMWARSQKWRTHDGDSKGMNDESTNIQTNPLHQNMNKWSTMQKQNTTIIS